MTHRKHIIEEIDALIEELGSPLSAGDLADGWTITAQAGISKYFRRIRDKLAEQIPIPDAELNVVRGLDSYGVLGGPLFHKICTIIHYIRNTNCVVTITR